MSIIDRFFKPAAKANPISLVHLGRYSDTYKKGTNYAAWSHALRAFEQGNYLDSYCAFFDYLKDEAQDNIRYTLKNDTLHFEIYQGSRKIEGFADAQRFRAEAKIACFDQLNVSFMRQLAEKNFSLKYSRFAIDPEKHIAILFDTFALDGSPYKLYFALKEVAVNADKLDDLLIDEFKALRKIENPRLVDEPQNLKEIKYTYIQNTIRTTLSFLQEGSLSQDQYPGGYAYVLLDLIYRLDYLTQPEGYMMESLERMHRVYFSSDGKSTLEKNHALVRECTKLAERSKADFFKEMYRASFTFGITHPVQHDQIIRFIDTELYNMDWYLENGHLEIARTIPGYIVGYTLFNYAPPKPIRDLLHLYYLICEPSYFLALGFDFEFYNPESSTLHKKNICSALEQIVRDNLSNYPSLYLPKEILDFNSLPAFVKSYLWMIRSIDPVVTYKPVLIMDA